MTDGDVERSAAAVLALLRLSPQGWPEIARRLRRGEAPLQVAQSLNLVGGSLFDEDPWDAAVMASLAELDAWRQEGLTVVAATEPRYPARLDVVRTLPPVFWSRGQADPRDASGVAVVGSRRATPEALEAAGALARELIVVDRVVISGLAAGVDTAAITAALSAGGRVVAVIGTGIRRSYPATNAALQERVATDGLLVSQFWPDSPPTKFSFPMRNELMSGWSSATLVIQADEKSGARMQARVAGEQGRLVMLYAPVMRHERWANEAVDRGSAKFVSSLDDILGELDGTRQH